MKRVYLLSICIEGNHDILLYYSTPEKAIKAFYDEIKVYNPFNNIVNEYYHDESELSINEQFNYMGVDKEKHFGMLKVSTIIVD